MSLRKEVYHYGSTIVKQGDPPPGLLFITQYVKESVLHYMWLVDQIPPLVKWWQWSICKLFFPIFSGQAKIVMNASQHSSQFPSMVNQNSIPIQNQLNRYKQKLSTLLIIPSNLKYDMQKSKMNYYVFDLGQIILRPKVRWSVTYYRSRCVCADETVTLLQRSVIAICL